MASMLWKLRFATGLALVVGLLVQQAALGAGAGSFGSTGSMGAARYGAVAARLPDGRVLVAGGYYDAGGDHYLASAEVFNAATNAFSSAGIGAMGTARRGAVAAPLHDGRVLVAGGSYDDGTEHSSRAPRSSTPPPARSRRSPTWGSRVSAPLRRPSPMGACSSPGATTGPPVSRVPKSSTPPPALSRRSTTWALTVPAPPRRPSPTGEC
ncbi:MAG TPA: kelch repeat-containing protein [Solirubrobacterales bacterium]